MRETFLPRVEIVGPPVNHIHKVKKGPTVSKLAKPYISRVIQGLNEERAEVRYIPLPGMSADDIDPRTLPHVTRAAAMNILADVARQKNSLATALKKKTARPYSPTVAEDRSERPLKIRPGATVYDRKKMEEARARNELTRMVLNGVFTQEQLSVIFFGLGYSVTEPNLIQPELPVHPFPKDKFKNLRPQEVREMRKQHTRNLMARQGNVYHR